MKQLFAVAFFTMVLSLSACTHGGKKSGECCDGAGKAHMHEKGHKHEHHHMNHDHAKGESKESCEECAEHSENQ